MSQHPKLCPHCVDLTNTLRGCGNMIGVTSLHYAMAAVLSARAEGMGIGDMHALVDMLAHVDAFDRRSDDVSPIRHVVDVVPLRVVTVELAPDEDGC